MAMSKRAFDLFNRSGSVDERIRRSLRAMIVGNIIVLIASTGTTIQLVIAIATHKIWRGHQGMEVGTTDFKRAIMFFGSLAAISAVSLVLLVRYYRKRTE